MLLPACGPLAQAIVDLLPDHLAAVCFAFPTSSHPPCGRMRGKKKKTTWDICTIVLLPVRSSGFGWIWEVDVVLTIAKMGAHSASYYDSTVDQGIGPDNYYSEAGSAPAQVWMRSNRVAECARGYVR